MKKFSTYLAGSIFYYGDELRNREWATKLREAFPGIDLYSPIENTDINGREGKKKFAGSRDIAKADNKRLDYTDVLIACIDGDVIPSGTSAEIGVMYEKIKHDEDKLIIGICTDNRQCYWTNSAEKNEGGASELGEQQYSYQNLYVTGLIKEAGYLVGSIEEAIEVLQDKYGEDEEKDEELNVVCPYCESEKSIFMGRYERLFLATNKKKEEEKIYIFYCPNCGKTFILNDEDLENEYIHRSGKEEVKYEHI